MNTPYDIPSQYATAQKDARQGRYQSAESILNQILDTDPSYLPALDLMGFVQYFLKQPAVAKEYCLRALEIKPNHTYALKGLGLCLAATGEVDEGVAYLKKAIAQTPTYFDPHWDLAVVLHRANRNHEALELLTAAKSNFPKQQNRIDNFITKIQQAGSVQ